jgi:Tfp pilus assembly protein PilP
MTVPVNKMRRVVLAAIVSVAMAAAFSCKDKAPSAPPHHAVNKKIAIQQSKPTPAPTAAPAKGAAPAQPEPGKPEALAQPEPGTPAAPAQPEPGKPEALAQPEPGTLAAPAGPAQVTPDDAASGGKQPVSDLIEESRDIASGYDSSGRFDPFEPLFHDESAASAAPSKGKRKKRTPQTPLERVAISQLKLSAIMRTAKGNSAIVEDASGKGYVIKKGTYIGLNAGQVIKIEKDRVLIEEEIENIMGEFVIQNTELKLQKPAGEL